MSQSTEQEMLPIVPASTVASLLKNFSVWTEGRGEVYANQLPTKEQAEQFRKRLSILDTHLRPFTAASPDKQSVQRGLAAWFLGYPSAHGTDAKGLIAAYMVDLKLLPAFAILRALEDFKRGRVTEKDDRGKATVIGQDFPPASPRVYAQAVKVMQDQVDEQIKIRRLLSAKPSREKMTEEQRKESRERVSILAGDAKAKINTRDQATIAMQEAARKRIAERAERSRAEFEAGALDEYADMGIEPRRIGGMIVSPELAAQLDPEVRSKLK